MTYSELESIGIPQSRVRKMVTEGDLNFLMKGIYSRATVDQTSQRIQLIAALKKVGKESSICLISALDYYNLIDEIPNKIWIMVDHKKRVQSNRIRLWRTRNPNWNAGIVHIDGIRISNIERTIVDTISQRRIVGHSVGIQALKNAIKSNQTNLKDVYKMAKRVGEEKKLMPIVRVLQS